MRISYVSGALDLFFDDTAAQQFMQLFMESFEKLRTLAGLYIYIWCKGAVLLA
jgi:hypothetical protein